MGISEAVRVLTSRSLELEVFKNGKAAHRKLDQLKSVCDDQICSEYPEREDAIKVYYGRGDEAEVS